MAIQIDQDVCLVKKSELSTDWHWQTRLPLSDLRAPFPGRAYTLTPWRRLRATGGNSERKAVLPAVRRSHKFEPVDILVGLDELVDVPVRHPLRNHYKLLTIHRDSYQWQHIWVIKGIPCHDFLAESLIIS